MVSRKSRYALRALLVLSVREDHAPMTICAIAQQGAIPRKFLEQILLELSRAGIVRSQRGRNGGYALGRPAQQISFADVLQVTNEPLAISACVGIATYQKCDDCFDEATCVLRRAFRAAYDATAQILQKQDLASAASEMRRSGQL